MTKRSRFVVVTVLIFSMVAMYGYMPVAKAASLTNVSDTISDSDVGATAVTHTLNFTTGVGLVATDYIEATLEGVTGILVGNVTCPASTTASVASNVVTCTATDAIPAAALQIIVATTTNPGTSGDYSADILTADSDDVEIESAQAKFYIIDDVTVTAHVDASLTFGVAGVASSTDVNNASCNVTTTATTTDFGTIQPGVAKTVCQELTVTTNASHGFTVTVAQDGNLESATGDDIDAFVDGTPAGAQAWTSPAGTLGSEETYGHFGVTSEDSSLSGGDTFGAAQYVGLTGVSPMEVMYHNGPADGSTANIGLTQVAYTVEIDALQEAGDYSSTLTYVATPTY